MEPQGLTWASRSHGHSLYVPRSRCLRAPPREAIMLVIIAVLAVSNAVLQTGVFGVAGGLNTITCLCVYAVCTRSASHAISFMRRSASHKWDLRLDQPEDVLGSDVRLGHFRSGTSARRPRQLIRVTARSASSSPC